VRGASPSVTLEPIIILEDGRIARESAESLLRSLQDSAPVPRGIVRDDAAFAAARARADEEIAYHRKNVEARVRERNAVLLEARKAAVLGSYKAKIASAEKQLEVADNERIRRMRQAQIRHLQARMEAKLEDLARGQDVAVSSTLLAGGRIRIVPQHGRSPVTGNGYASR
jgi:hypothetical protein